MDNMFLIIELEDCYEACPFPIGYVTSEEEAKSICDKLNSLYNRAVKYSDLLKQKIKDIGEKDLNLEDSIKIPKWEPGLGDKDISAEKRAERDEIVAKNEEIKIHNQKILKERRAEIKKVVSDEISLIDDVEFYEYAKKTISSLGHIKTRLSPYFYREINKLS